MDIIQILKMPDSSAMIALIHEEGGAEHSHKIGYFIEKTIEINGHHLRTGEILVSNPEGLLYFVNEIGIDKFVEIQQEFSGTATELPLKTIKKI